MLVPVHPGKGRPIYLHSVHPYIAGIGIGIFGMNYRKCNKWTAIFWPAGYNRKFSNIRFLHDHFLAFSSPTFYFWHPGSKLAKLW